MVRSGDTLSAISEQYGVSTSDLWIANRLSNPHLLRPGQSLVIPEGPGEVFGPRAGRRLAWPVYGVISSPFGMRGDGMHEGLDISAPRGTPIRAAAAGRVVELGAMGNYGLAVIIDHGQGLQTLYAHCDRLLVRRGARVEAGQVIAVVGSTGRSTGPHLHFEVIVRGERVDPLGFLLVG